MAKQWDGLWTGAHLATMAVGEGDYGAIFNGALAVSDGKIAWVGPAADLPGEPHQLATQVRVMAGGWITPGLVDCHTHLVFGGNRAREFERRLSGVSYEEIAREGGGINATVTHTRAASEAVLFSQSAERLQNLLNEGLTTVEIKSGYGLDLETELKMLRVAKRLGREFPLNVRTTYLGAHALPPEYKTNRKGYLDLVVDTVLPAVAAESLANAVDVFCESIGFSQAETRRVFDKAKSLGLAVKLHADQLQDGGGAALAAEYGALSADHLEYTSEAGVRAMKAAGTVAVLLPGAFYTLRETQLPPLAQFREHGVPMALATDCNPGSSPLSSLLTVLNMSCTLFRMTPAEALAGLTCHGAQALGLAHKLGTLEVGKQADLAHWQVETPAELAYWMGANPLTTVVKDGKVVKSRASV